jgi:glycosyltransferase involved in cell wall biosynthesis
VLFVGTLQLRKGVPYLLDAARLLKGESIHIRLVGPSHLSDNAIRQLRDETEVIRPVSRSEIERHYAWADVLVLPTLSEGSANVCHEAMAAGLPVITTANAGSTIHHGSTGLLVPVRNSHALADAIALLHHDEELRRGLAALALSRHQPDALAAYGCSLGACLAAPARTRAHQPAMTVAG